MSRGFIYVYILESEAKPVQSLLGATTGPAQNLLYFGGFSSMLWIMTAWIDSNIWGFLAMPLGVAVCFGPVLLVWLKEEYFASPPEDRQGDL